MDNQKKNIHKSKEERCEICGNILTKGMCSNCGWVQIIFPNIVPSEIKDFNTQRKETAKKLYKEGCDSKIIIEELEKDYNDEISKNLKSQQDLKLVTDDRDKFKAQVDKAQKELASAKKENQGLVDKVQSLTSQNETLKKQISMLESAAKVVEAQRKDLFEKLKKANINLTIEINKHKETKLKLEQLEANNPINVTQEQPQAQPQPYPRVTQQQGQPVAKIVFSSGIQTIQKNVFDGNNNYMIPSSMNSTVYGDAFRIESLDGKVFRLYDICGLTCKVNGDKISTTGMQLYDKDYFSVGHITIQIKLPKMNLRDLIE